MLSATLRTRKHDEEVYMNEVRGAKRGLCERSEGAKRSSGGRGRAGWKSRVREEKIKEISIKSN